MKVSVCMAVHNGAPFLREQIDSILLQLEQSDELIISDDASTDGSLQIVQSFNDSRIKILPPKKFESPVKNFEYVLKNAGNEIIFLADQDDIWYADKIKIMKHELQHCDLLVCDCQLVDEADNVITDSFYLLNESGSGLLKNFFKNSFVGCCMAFKREILTKALPFPEGISMHDQWIGLMAQKHFIVKFIPHILVGHRRHNSNFSTTGGKSHNSLKKKLISRIKLAKLLLQR
ncbi:MAG: glycosyltransferase [Bacteroidetes bacterium]|nr:glycosyltransferase [Bacteroidota bacterium]